MRTQGRKQGRNKREQAGGLRGREMGVDEEGSGHRVLGAGRAKVRQRGKMQRSVKKERASGASFLVPAFTFLTLGSCGLKERSVREMFLKRPDNILEFAARPWSWS
ncbi:RIIa domain-containing protein 1 isoform X2 [Psammomys obesus]|uniref:RIIa domain-containing protein 1 isoform X2 n=1 Tax=Psammomys obesus TaxID=48139 RepID=UPI0024533AAD|nr:RIIa domain-containing protein 1 isoform X2 [Psammomys obesus]